MNIYDEIINQFESVMIMSKLLGYNSTIIPFTDDCSVLWIPCDKFTITVSAWKNSSELVILVSDNSYKANQDKYSLDKEFEKAVIAIQDLTKLL